MIKLLFATGGRPRANNDLQALQNELYAAVEGQYQGYGAFIVSGCQVSQSGAVQQVAPGLVYLDGFLQRFAGFTGPLGSLPAELVSAPLRTFDTRPYPVGAKDCMSEQKAVLQAPTTGGTVQRIALLAGYGGLTWAQVRQAGVRTLAEVQYLANLTSADYDTTGKGVVGGAAWGWALCNGQNATADLRGMFVVGHNPSRVGTSTPFTPLTITKIGDSGGEEMHRLIVSEMPGHAHNLTPPVANPGNAGAGNAIGKTDAGNPGLYTATTSAIGGDGAHENRPPYYALGVRQWVGY